MHTILLVGADQTLLDTRAKVLRTTGSEALSSSAESALAVQARRSCDLVVLCHSLCAEESDAIARAIRAGWPKTRILQLVPGGAFFQPVENKGVDAVSSAQPERLVASASELLAREPSAGPDVIQPSPANGRSLGHKGEVNIPL